MYKILKTERNLGLTKLQFENLLTELRNGNEQLFEKLFIRFFKKNLALLKEKYHAEHNEAYDCIMWAMLRMRQMLIEGKIEYGNLENYFSRIAVTRYIKSQSRKKEFATETVPEFRLGEEHFFCDETLNILEKAWGKLDPKSKELLKGFYYDKIKLKQLTTILGDSSPANTRKRKERSLKKLRQLFFEYY